MIRPKSLLLIAIGASLMGIIADLLLLYQPNGGYEDGTYRFLLYIPYQRLVWGHYLGLFFIPLEIAGLFVFTHLLKVANIWTMFTGGLAVLTIAGGIAVHTSVLPFARQIQLEDQKCELVNPDMDIMIENYKEYIEPTSLLFFALFSALSLVIGYLLTFKQDHLPKWLTLINPLLIYLAVVVIYILFPALGNILLPAGFNLAFLIFFILLYQNSETPQKQNTG